MHIVMDIIMKRLVYTFLGVIADALDIVLTSFMGPDKRPQLSIEPSDVDQLSDKEIVELLQNAQPLTTVPSPSILDSDTVCKLTTHTVVKLAQDLHPDPIDTTEANALNLLFAETTIPVPRVRRVVRSSDGYVWIVMDYIPGPTLAHVWPTLSIWRKIGIGFTLRRYIRQLRRLKASAATPPGPPSSCRQGPRICESPIFGDIVPYRGPFTSYSAFSTFFNERHQMIADIDKIPHDDPSRNEHFDDSEPLVLTHQDLNLRNIIVGEGGRLWIIDWAWAGYYPPYFEYVTMLMQNADKDVSGTNDKFWKALIPFVCDPYFRQERWLNRMLGSFNYK